MTNYEKIKNMSAREMAEFIVGKRDWQERGKKRLMYLMKKIGGLMK